MARDISTDADRADWETSAIKRSHTGAVSWECRLTGALSRWRFSSVSFNHNVCAEHGRVGKGAFATPLALVSGGQDTASRCQLISLTPSSGPVPRM
jgi:hypothetical protein